jgi:hypothetical protein
MSARRCDTHLSSPALDALLADRLSAAARVEAEAHLRACSRCHADAAQARAAQRHFADVILPRTLARMRSRRVPRAPSRPRWRWRVLGWSWLGAAAAILRIVGLRPSEPDLMTKGNPSLRLVTRRDRQIFLVQNGSHLRAGDEIRFVIAAAPQPFLLIGSIDGDGQASIYFPFEGQMSAAIDARAGRVELPGSIVLDGGRGPERVFALLSDAPLASAEVRRALQALAAGGPAAIRATTRLPVAAAAQLSVVFEKDAR